MGGNAFFVIGEYAVVTARRGALAARAEAGSAGARAALRLMDDPVRVISTVQVGITALGILTGAIAEPLVRDLLGDGIPHWLAFVLAFAIITYLSVVLGELVPKALTLDRAETLAAIVAPPVEMMSAVLRPVVWVLQGSAALLLKPFGVSEVVAGEGVRTPEELRALVDEAEGSGVIPRSQEELLHNAFDFTGREARDVMVPALDVDWLDAGLTVREALATALDHSRLPVGRGALDRLAGVVHVRDLVHADPDVTVGDLARPAHVVPPTKDLGALVRELCEQRRHLAVVGDEYGGTAGIVTLADVLEELVGELEGDPLTWHDEGTVDAAGSMTIGDFNEAAGTRLPQRGPRTLAGLVFDELGRLPSPGDAVELEGTGLRVERVDGARITRVRVALRSA